MYSPESALLFPNRLMNFGSPFQTIVVDTFCFVQSFLLCLRILNTFGGVHGGYIVVATFLDGRLMLRT